VERRRRNDTIDGGAGTDTLDVAARGHNLT